MELQGIKQRFGIIGNDPALNRALDIAAQVAPTDISVLVIGESGVGKENIPQVIHALSARKHGPYIAVNCGAIPEGTIDSELFGHEKGSFTGANESRKGYFEVADKGTIFLDEVAELPLSTQVRLLRVLESKEFMKVGSSKVQKTDVRVVAATNVNMARAVKEGRFREDLYYRLNTVQINMPPLRERGNDILLLFRKFATDFAEKYNMPLIRLDESGKQVALSYRWPGNVRQLRNITEQISIIEQQRDVSGEILVKYLPDYKEDTHPAIVPAHQGGNADFASEREILYKVLFDMKNDIAELKKEMKDLIGGGTTQMRDDDTLYIPQDDYSPYVTIDDKPVMRSIHTKVDTIHNDNVIDTNEITHHDSLSLTESEFNLINKALERHNGKRKAAAQELGISERTLYRKLKEYNITR
ncbi:MAG: sigma-54-dependent Fis family transcriptional regulator [Bacteroidales bacterium]|nr:sigma-54-dependent Fis family transcriptional regulator [Bacteroidales bacterium]MBP5682945.1 sigma-54-dependent Fis family transcriptional regulator [Bacteroidales bacterium]